MTTVAATVSRTSLGLGALSLTTAPYYLFQDSPKASGLDPGQVVKSRIWATSPYVPGGIEVFSMPGITTMNLHVGVQDTSQAATLTDIDTLVTAFSQAGGYTLSASIGTGASVGVFAWTCYDADYSIDPYPIDSVVPTSPMYGVHFVIPRSPIPVSGPI